MSKSRKKNFEVKVRIKLRVEDARIYVASKRNPRLDNRVNLEFEIIL